MHLFKFCTIFLGLLIQTSVAQIDPLDSLKTFRKAFSYISGDFGANETINICLYRNIPIGYESTLNMPVCDDKLCANVVLSLNIDCLLHHEFLSTASPGDKNLVPSEIKQGFLDNQR